MSATSSIAMGANLVPGGATFRCWAPAATAVYVRGDFNGWSNSLGCMTRDDAGYWSQFVPDIGEGTQYKFFVVNNERQGYKRDPYARALTLDPPFPFANCIVTRPDAYPWHDDEFRPPEFSDLVIYQFHVGVYYATDVNGADERLSRSGRFLDLLFQLEHLAQLGINAIEPLPIVEFPTDTSLGYNGTDYFSPEMKYTVPPDDPGLQRYVDKANDLLTRRGQTRLLQLDDLKCQTKQLMAMVDLCHVYGIAVLFDVVYNHAGGGFDDESLYFFDQQPRGDNNNSLYFTDQGWAGGLIFAFWKPEVRQFLIDNASFFREEYHADGFRFDEVTVIDSHGGWSFCQNLTDTLRYFKPDAPLIAEYWHDDQSWVVKPTGEQGAGFDDVWVSGFRQAMRGALQQVAAGRYGDVNLDAVAASLHPPFADAWRGVQHLENHDVVRIDNTTDRQPRMAALADSSNSRSWYGRSRSRLANGLLMTAAGAPMLFMGQEILEDKYWSDNDQYFRDTLVWWDGLQTDKAMQDHLRFMSDLIDFRRGQPALRSNNLHVFHVHNENRMIAFHRWLENTGQDVIIVASLNESTCWSYRIGFPFAGRWREAFNSDLYDNFPNIQVAGNSGSIEATNDPLHGFPASASIVIPANTVLAFLRQ